MPLGFFYTIDLNATTNVYMKTVDGSTFSNQEFTISMWLKWPRGITSGWKTLAEFNRTFGSDHWGLFTHANGDALHFRDGIDYVAFTPELSEWYNISVSVATDGDVILYVNGEVLAEGEADPRTISEGLLTIGANNEGTEISNAIIDELRIYNIELSQAEIQNIINPGTSWTLSTKVIGSGQIELSPSGNTYIDGTTVGLKAIPGDGWQFAGWSDGLSGIDNPAEIVMYLDKNILKTT